MIGEFAQNDPSVTTKNENVASLAPLQLPPQTGGEPSFFAPAGEEPSFPPASGGIEGGPIYKVEPRFLPVCGRFVPCSVAKTGRD